MEQQLRTPVDAGSLDSITNLADDPPLLLPDFNASLDRRRGMVLWIARVPESKGTSSFSGPYSMLLPSLEGKEILKC
jgi:hypothetical protein